MCQYRLKTNQYSAFFPGQKRDMLIYVAKQNKNRCGKAKRNKTDIQNYRPGQDAELYLNREKFCEILNLRK